MIQQVRSKLRDLTGALRLLEYSKNHIEIRKYFCKKVSLDLSLMASKGSIEEFIYFKSTVDDILRAMKATRTFYDVKVDSLANRPNYFIARILVDPKLSTYDSLNIYYDTKTIAEWDEEFYKLNLEGELL